ncbi:MAG: 16S rRNA (adenine(1518)-N(6)/adenine(1519)-N(6))-dimethyltransferase, partial [Okeania sp. SIO2D1]|nr:16S rRNA (adenine(1518)-N(6)/adenine(1519)-N(6))-dimethyltransferase [Okeania sp. SIO2D1]
ILELDWQAHLQAWSKFQHPNKVVANIPYNITGPILAQLLGKISQPVSQKFTTIVLLVQKEIAQSLTAKAGSRNFGLLSVRVGYLANCELICPVPAKAFYPPPKVDSAVIRLTPRKIEHPACNPKQLETLLKMGFSSKRKMLRNNLKAIIPSDRLSQLLEKLEINSQARAEDLSVRDWVNLSNNLSSTPSAL